MKLLSHKIASDHSEATEVLREIARVENRTIPPQSASSGEDLRKLRALHGPQFDKAYLMMMVDHHKKDISLFLDVATNGKDIALQQFAQRSLPHLQEHLYLAQQLEQVSAN